MGKLRINENGLPEPEDHPCTWEESPAESTAGDPSMSSATAAHDAYLAILTLHSNAWKGERYALESMHLLARELCEILNDQNREVRFEGQARENWDELLRAETAWPAMIPAETNRQKEVLATINALPLGDSVGYKLYKTHRGHKRPPGEPAAVAVSVMMSIARIRNRILSDPPDSFSDEDLATLHRSLPVSLIAAIRALPPFSASSLQEWKNVVRGFIEIPEKRRLFIPERWRQEALNGGCGYMAHVRKTIFEGLDTICQPPNPLE